MNIGTTRIDASGYVDNTNISRVFAIIIVSTGGGGGVVSLKDGNTTTLSTNTGTASTGIPFNFNGGILFPNGCYVSMDANTSYVTVLYVREPSSAVFPGNFSGLTTDGTNSIASGPIWASNGSASAPSISLAALPTWGFYNASGLLGLSLDTSHTLTFNGSGAADSIITCTSGALNLFGTGAFSAGINGDTSLNIAAGGDAFAVDLYSSNCEIIFDDTTNTNKGSIILKTNADANIAGQFDSSATAGDTRFLLWDVNKGALSRVSVGASDSGGSGFKLLRVPN